MYYDTKKFVKLSKGLAILIVESNLVLADEYRDILSHLFDTIEVVNSAEEALLMYEANRFSIILVNLDLPQMNGIEMISNIINDDNNQKFIALIDENDAAKLIELYRMNISSCIFKPFNLENFINIAYDMLRILSQDRLIEEQTKPSHLHVSEITENSKFSDPFLIQQSKLAQTGEMISMIAHQWRQPLSVITAITGKIRTRMDLDIYKRAEDPYAQLESDLHDAFIRIEEAADFLSKTVNDFRNFYRPANKVTTFNASALIDSVCRMALLDKNQLDIEVEIQKDESIVLTSYENELKQVLINIVNNAKDAFIEMDTVKPKLYITLKKEGEYVYLNIIDNGGGIPTAIIDKIFLPYFSTKSQKNGTGIGLHMAKTIIEHHIGGNLSVTNNELFGGADFCIKIPASIRGESI